MKKKVLVILFLLLSLMWSTCSAVNWITVVGNDRDGRLEFDGDSIKHELNRNNVYVTGGYIRWVKNGDGQVITFIVIRDSDLAYVEGDQCVYNQYGNRLGCQNNTGNGIKMPVDGSNLQEMFSRMVRYNRKYGSAI